MADKNLKARVAKEAKMASFLRTVRENETALSKATWEESLTVKDKKAIRNRITTDVLQESQLHDRALKQERREKLTALYSMDEAQYEQELQSMGLAFKKDRL